MQSNSWDITKGPHERGSLSPDIYPKNLNLAWRNEVLFVFNSVFDSFYEKIIFSKRFLSTQSGRGVWTKPSEIWKVQKVPCRLGGRGRQNIISISALDETEFLFFWKKFHFFIFSCISLKIQIWPIRYPSYLREILLDFNAYNINF